MTVILSEGVYAVGETATLKPERRTFTNNDRLTSRAEVLPDDPDWHTGRMPTLIHTLPLTGPRARNPLIFGMLTEVSHVTISSQNRSWPLDEADGVNQAFVAAYDAARVCE